MQKGYLCLDGSTLRSSTGDVGILVPPCIVFTYTKLNSPTSFHNFLDLIRYKAEEPLDHM